MVTNFQHCMKIGALLVSSMLITAPAMADVTLEGLDGSFAVTGELLGIDERGYRIRSDIGDVIVRQEFVRCIGEDCPNLDEDQSSDDKSVILSSTDNSVSLQGTLVEITDTSYVVDTTKGRLTAPRAGVSCEGPGCPEVARPIAKISVAVPDDIASDLLTAFITDFSATQQFNVTQLLASTGERASILIGDPRGIEIARVGIETVDLETTARRLLTGDVAFAIVNKRMTPAFLSNITGQPVTNVAQVMRENVVGLDAISFVVPERNNIDIINMNDIENVMSGQFSNWGQLGGADAPINVHMTRESSQTIVEQLQIKGMTNAAVPPSIVLHDSAADLTAAVKDDATAIGVLYRSEAADLKRLNLATACRVYVDDSDFAVQTEEYPLAVRWYSYADAKRAPSELARRLSMFIGTNVGQQTLAGQGLVTQQLRTIPMQDQGARLLTSILTSEGNRDAQNIVLDYVEEVANARRISTSLRFLSGSATLDARAVADIERISQIVQSPQYEGYELLVFGFSDALGRLDANLALSARRAESVRDILLSRNAGFLDNSNVQTFGVGPVAPVNCNDTDLGRQQNRRVEIWIRPRS